MAAELRAEDASCRLAGQQVAYLQATIRNLQLASKLSSAGVLLFIKKLESKESLISSQIFIYIYYSSMWCLSRAEFGKRSGPPLYRAASFRDSPTASCDFETRRLALMLETSLGIL